MAILNRAAVADHFDPAEFDDLVATHGTPVLWRKAVTCPCFNLETGRAEVDCPFCDTGLGIIWDAGSEQKMLAPGRQQKDNYDEAGMWMQGMVTLTFPSTITPGHLDRIEFLVARMVVNNERHVRGAVDSLGRSRERCRIAPVFAVESCQAILNADLPPAQRVLVPYTAPLNFTIDEATGVVDWQDGPDAGTHYALRYLTRASYVVWSPQSRDEGGTGQPYRAMAQRFDFFRNVSAGEAVH